MGDAGAVRRFGSHYPLLKQLRAQPCGAGNAGGQFQFLLDQLRTNALNDGRAQSIQPRPRLRRNPGAHGDSVLVAFDARDFVRAQVNLVVHLQPRHGVCADVRQHRLHLLDAAAALGVGGINHVQQQAGLAGFLQRGAERRHQVVRQIAHKSDRVSQHRLTIVRQLQPAQRGVQRGEQLGRHVGAGAGERIEQRGLAGIGVTDQRHRDHVVAHPRTPVLFTAAAHLFEP